MKGPPSVGETLWRFEKCSKMASKEGRILKVKQESGKVPPHETECTQRMRVHRAEEEALQKN